MDSDQPGYWLIWISGRAGPARFSLAYMDWAGPTQKRKNKKKLVLGWAGLQAYSAWFPLFCSFLFWYVVKQVPIDIKNSRKICRSFWIYFQVSHIFFLLISLYNWYVNFYYKMRIQYMMSIFLISFFQTKKNKKNMYVLF